MAPYVVPPLESGSQQAPSQFHRQNPRHLGGAYPQQQQFAQIAGRQGISNRGRIGGGRTGKSSRSGGMDGKPKNQNQEVNRQLSEAAYSGDSTQLLSIIDITLSSMNGINLATALHRVAKLATIGHAEAAILSQHPTVQQLINAILIRIGKRPDVVGEISSYASMLSGTFGKGQLSVQCMSIVAWSLATLQIHHDELFTIIASITSTRLDELQPFELTNLAWAYGKISPPIKCPELFDAITQCIFNRRNGHYKVQSLACLLWAGAATGYHSRWGGYAFFNTMEQDISMGATELKPLDISGVLWAYAVAGIFPPRLFQALGDACCRGAMLSAFKPQELSRALWSFAAAGFSHQHLFHRAEHLILDSCKDLTTIDVVDILWAYARNRVTIGSALCAALLDLSLRRLGKHSLEELSALIWAAARICPERVDFLEEVAQQLLLDFLDDLTEGSLENVANTVEIVSPASPEIFADGTQHMHERVGLSLGHGNQRNMEKFPSQRSVCSVSNASFGDSMQKSEAACCEAPNAGFSKAPPSHSSDGILPTASFGDSMEKRRWPTEVDTDVKEIGCGNEVEHVNAMGYHPPLGGIGASVPFANRMMSEAV